MAFNIDGWTDPQKHAVLEQNKTLLISAAAGSGKTFTLTTRILYSLLEGAEPVSLQDMLIVTFTNMAVSELKNRICAELDKTIGEKSAQITSLADLLVRTEEEEAALGRLRTELARLQKEKVLLPSAHIYTIDGFCNDLVKKHAEEVGLSAGYRVPDNVERTLLAEETVEKVIRDVYEGVYADTVTPEAFAAFADTVTKNRSDDSLGEVLIWLYEKTCATETGVKSLYPLVQAYDYHGDLDEKAPFLSYVFARIREDVKCVRDCFLPIAQDEARAGTNAKLSEFVNTVLSQLSAIESATTYTAMKEALSVDFAQYNKQAKDDIEVRSAKEVWAQFKAQITKKILPWFSYTPDQFLALFPAMHDILQTFVCVLEIYDRIFIEEKQRRGLCDYSDMERYCHDLLWQEGALTPLALSLRGEYKAVYIDEYQDVSSLQDSIFRAVANARNRFMVGDIKQSIYAFRSADPRVFARLKDEFPPYKKDSPSDTGAIFMSENFRCDLGVVKTVNEVFDVLFGQFCEGIGYKKEERLIFHKKDPTYERKTHMVLIDKPTKAEKSALDEDADTAAAVLEAEAVAAEVEGLLKTGYNNEKKPLHPRDIVLLARKRTHAAVYAAALQKRGIPFCLPQTPGIFGSEEIQLVLCLLNAIDNPERDVYMAGLLCSPLYGFSPDDLIAFRRASDTGTLYFALKQYAAAHPEDGRVSFFLQTLASYRLLAEGMPMDAFLSRLYKETGLWLLASRQGSTENLLVLYEHARSFEGSSLHGLYAFISYVNRMMELKLSFDAPKQHEIEDAVHFYTVHSSKGLQFPVVFLVGCSQLYRTKEKADDDTTLPLAYAEDFGLAVRLRDKTGLLSVDNPLFHIIEDCRLRRAQEETYRVLYVALTRAQERLFIFGITSKKQELWNACRCFPSPLLLRCATCDTDLLRMTLSDSTVVHTVPFSAEEEATAVCPPDPLDLVMKAEEKPDTPQTLAEKTDPPTPQKPLTEEELLYRLSFPYPNPVGTVLPEKLSVSFLSPVVLDGSEDDTPALSLDAPLPIEEEFKPYRLPTFFTGEAEDDSAKRGIATHQFLQFCQMKRLLETDAERELSCLLQEKFLTEEDAALVRLPEIEKFRASSLLDELIRAKNVYREFRFNVEFPAALFTADPQKKKALADTPILVQGVIDCIIERQDGELWLIDYKTDRLSDFELQNRAFSERKLREKHRLQLTYYAKAIEHIFGKTPKVCAVYSLPLGDLVRL